MTITNPNPLLTVEEAAEYSNRTPGTFRYLLSTGKGPKSGKVGGRRMIRVSDLEAWINAAFEEAK